MKKRGNHGGEEERGEETRKGGEEEEEWRRGMETEFQVHNPCVTSTGTLK